MTTRITEMNAKVTADTDNVLAGLERVKRANIDIGRVAQQSNTLAGKSVDVLAGKMDKLGQATSGVLNATYALGAEGSARVLALGNAVGSVAGLLGPGGKAVQGFAIVGSAIAALFLQAKEKSAEATKAIEEDLERLVNAADFAQITRRLQDIDQGTAGKQFEDGRVAIRARIETLKEEANTVGKTNKFYQERFAKIIEEKKQLALLDAEYQKFYKALTSPRSAPRASRAPIAITTTADSPEAQARAAKQLSDALASLNKRALELEETFSSAKGSDKAKTDVEQLVEAYERAGVPITTLQKKIADLTAEYAKRGADGKAVDKEFQQRADTILGKYKQQFAIITRLSEQQEKLSGKETAALAAKSLATQEALNEALKTQNAATVSRLEKRDDEREAAKQRIADAEGEIAALMQGAEAYDNFLRKQAQDAAAREVIAKARAEGRKLADGELRDAKTNAAYLFDAAKLAAQLQAALKDSGAGKLAAELAEVAERATAIATSLGAGGTNIAKIAAIAGPLFKGLSQFQLGLQERDAKGGIVKGETVSLFAALRGKNGAESQAQSAAASIAIVGVLFQIADALDLFGKQAKAKAKEMDAAAREFGKALEDLIAIADPQSGAAADIRAARRQAEEGAKAAAASFGGVFNSLTEVTSKQLREEAKLLREVLAFSTVGFSKKDIARVTAGAARFEELADALERAEEAARENVLRNIEDLNVRKLVGMGLTEEGELLRRKLAAEREIRAAEGDRTDVGLRYLSLLKETLAIEEARAAFEARRAAALQLLDDSLDVFGGTATDVLNSTVNALRSFFPQFTEIFDGLNLGSAEGLSTAKTRLQDLFRSLTSDGVITDAERPIVDAIKRLLGNIENAFGELTDPLTAALEVFGVRVEVFGLDAKAQFEALAAIFGDAFPELDELLAGASGGSLEDLKGSLQARIAALLEGGIDADEQPLLDALRQLLKTVVGQIDDAARAAEEAAAKAEEARQQRVADAARRVDGEIALGGLEGNAALQARIKSLAGLSPVFAQLLPLFGDTSASGIRGTKDALFQLFRDIEDGKVNLSQFGDLTKEEIIARIIELNGGLDGLADSLTEAAKAAEEAAAAERKQTNDLRVRLAKSRGEEFRLAEFDARAEDERNAAVAAGRSGAFLQFLDQVLASERSKLLADIAGEATSAAITAAAETAQRNQASQQITRTVGNATEVSVQASNSYLREIATNTRTSANAQLSLLQVLSGLRVNGSAPIPSLPALNAAGNGGGVTIGQLVVQAPTLQLPIGASPTETGTAIGRAQVRVIDEALGRITGTKLRFLGGGVR